MGRFREVASDDGNEGQIDMGPMIDCVFILLIFFIVTTTFVEETGVEVDKPQAASASRLEKTSILIAITANGEVIFDGRNIGIGGVQPMVKQKIQKEQLPVILQGDTNANYGLVVRVIDECKLAGAEKVSVATVAKRS
jgi:biopolymer transport protein ExbD